MPVTGEAPFYTFGFDQPDGITTVTAPDNTVMETHTIVAAGQWNDGFVNKTITRQGAGGPILSQMELEWERDANAQNPRPRQFIVKNDAQQAVTIVVTYSTFNNVTVSSIRVSTVSRSDVWKLTIKRFRRTNRRLLHLPTIAVFMPVAQPLRLRHDYIYDTNGSNLVARNDIIMHEAAFNPFAGSG